MLTLQKIQNQLFTSRISALVNVAVLVITIIILVLKPGAVMI